MRGWPSDRYDVVLCDLPWSYFGDPLKMGAAGKEYDLMEDADVLKLPICDILSPRGVLFLWATCPRLDFAVEALRAWGLYFRGVPFVWVKIRQDGVPIGAQGVRPSIVKPTTELVLAASKTRRGRPLPLADESVRQVVLAPKREHSRKPDEVQERIETLYPTASRLELFARPPHREGWDVWGNEVRI